MLGLGEDPDIQKSPEVANWPRGSSVACVQNAEMLVALFDLLMRQSSLYSGVYSTNVVMLSLFCMVPVSTGGGGWWVPRNLK